MEPRTAFVIVIAMTLLNGAVLGLMHRALSPDVRPAADDWRIGTLLAATGSIMLAFQAQFPVAIVLPVGNGFVFLGGALYWRSIRRFHGLPPTGWIYGPGLVSLVGIVWFAVIEPDLRARVAVASVGWVVPTFLAGWTLRVRRAAELAKKDSLSGDANQTVSNSVLAGIFFFIAAFMTFRGLYFLGFASPTVSLLDASNWLNLVTPLLLAVLPVVGTTAFLLMCSERIRRQWEMAAATDYLTALPNRRTIMGTGEARFNAARRAATPFAVAVLDIDHFKSINDRFGHAVGDQALKHVAKVLTVACRGPNMVGRHGGEEFVALLEGATVAEARLAGERLRRAIEDEAFVAKLKNGGQTLALTVSVGVATLGAKDGLFEDLLGRADQALYAAKENGRNRVEASAPEALPSA